MILIPEGGEGIVQYIYSVKYSTSVVLKTLSKWTLYMATNV